jgi:hypothetical protein
MESGFLALRRRVLPCSFFPSVSSALCTCMSWDSASGKRQQRITLRSITRKRPSSLVAEIVGDSRLNRAQIGRCLLFLRNTPSQRQPQGEGAP